MSNSEKANILNTLHDQISSLTQVVAHIWYCVHQLELCELPDPVGCFGKRKKKHWSVWGENTRGRTTSDDRKNWL